MTPRPRAAKARASCALRIFDGGCARRVLFYNFPMPNIKISAPHQLGQDEAQSRITRLISDSRAKFGDKVTDLKEAWNGNIDTFSFRAMGLDIDGHLEVKQTEVLIDINFPWMAMPFKSQIETEILKRAKELLA